MRNVMVFFLLLFVSALLPSCGGGGGGSSDTDATAYYTFYKDADGDGYSDGTSQYVETAPSDYYLSSELTAISGDCDDADGAINTSATEVWYDGVDQDCSATSDFDQDGDGEDSDAYSGTDCDDDDPVVHPAAPELYDFIDNDCDGSVDEGWSIYYEDADGDGYGSGSVTAVATSQPTGYVADATDCDDNDPVVNPNGAEVCNEVDDNCDGAVDEGVTTTFYADWDADGYGAGAVEACTLSAGLSYLDGDCNDTEPAAFPYNPEIADGIDNNCDGLVDDSITFTDSVTNMEFIYVAPGTFTMGDEWGDGYTAELPTHEVTISRGFYMGKYEVTQAQWQAVMGTNPSGFSGNPVNPVEQVSWDDIQLFISALNTDNGNGGCVRGDAGCYFLPTEAQWEYAAKGGHLISTPSNKYAGTSDVNLLGDYAWYYDNGYAINGLMSYEVGTKLPNELGLHDMSGNVYEWVEDWYSDSYYSVSFTTDPTGPTTGSDRVLRGGGWGDGAREVRSAIRTCIVPGSRYYFLGFRLAMAPPAIEHTETINGVDFTTIYVAPGTFTMGDEWGEGYPDELPLHDVTLTQGFFMGKHEVTQAQWMAVMGSNPSSFSSNPDNPVEQVSWDDVQLFISSLNIDNGNDGCVRGDSGCYYLPTEAQWEYTAKGGPVGTARFTKYAGSDTVDDVAWYSGNSSSITHIVGTKAPNELGIHDMSGNVYEWVQDWHSSSYYSVSPSTDPTGPATGTYRSVRGGGQHVDAFYVRTAMRFPHPPGTRSFYLGFRLAMNQ